MGNFKFKNINKNNKILKIKKKLEKFSKIKKNWENLSNFKKLQNFSEMDVNLSDFKKS